MKQRNKTITKTKKSGLVKAFYIIAAVLAAIWIYMIVYNMISIKSYADGYGLELADMKLDILQYLLINPIGYFIYAVIVFAAGKILNILQNAGFAAAGGKVCAAEDSASCADAVLCENPAEPETADADGETSAEPETADADGETSAEPDAADADEDTSAASEADETDIAGEESAEEGSEEKADDANPAGGETAAADSADTEK